MTQDWQIGTYSVAPRRGADARDDVHLDLTQLLLRGVGLCVDDVGR